MRASRSNPTPCLLSFSSASLCSRLPNTDQLIYFPYKILSSSLHPQAQPIPPIPYPHPQTSPSPPHDTPACNLHGTHDTNDASSSGFHKMGKQRYLEKARQAKTNHQLPKFLSRVKKTNTSGWERKVATHFVVPSILCLHFSYVWQNE